jgi:hypothetical protein
MLDDSLKRDMGRFLFSLDQQDFASVYESGRMAIRLVDTRTQHPHPIFDTAPGLRVFVPQTDLVFETSDGREFRLLRGETTVAQGPIEGVNGGHDGHSHAERALDPDVSWSARVEAFFPNYLRGAEGGDATRGPDLTNPAVRWTLLADGEPVGSDLAFQAPQYRGMRFTDLPIQAVFEAYEPTTLTTWEEGNEITLRLRFTAAGNGEAIGEARVAVGELHELSVDASEAGDVPTTGPAAAESEIPSLGTYSASLVGRMPAAYSGLSVMRESMGMKIFFYVSFLLFLGGPLLAFTAAHCQVWAWVAPDGSRALVGGRARGRRAKLSQILDRVEAEVKEDDG